MATTKQLLKILEEAKTLKLITQSLGEMSAIRLRRIRNGVEKNRLFFEDISKVYHSVKLYAAHTKIPLPAKNGKTISVILTTNEHFSGDLNSNLIDYYLTQTSKFTTDRLVIGQSGINYFKVNYSKDYLKLVCKNDLPTYEELKSISGLISRYQRVLVFHTFARTMLSQIPTVKDITESAYLDESQPNNLEYIFEPEIAKVALFFDTQINILLLEQTFFEAELARIAARLIVMSQGERSADKYLKEQTQAFISAKNALSNANIIESLIPQFKLRSMLNYE